MHLKTFSSQNACTFLNKRLFLIFFLTISVLSLYVDSSQSLAVSLSLDVTMISLSIWSLAAMSVAQNRFSTSITCMQHDAQSSDIMVSKASSVSFWMLFFLNARLVLATFP